MIGTRAFRPLTLGATDLAPVFKRWIALSTGLITIQRIAILENQLGCPLDSDFIPWTF